MKKHLLFIAFASIATTLIIACAEIPGPLHGWASVCASDTDCIKGEYCKGGVCNPKQGDEKKITEPNEQISDQQEVIAEKEQPTDTQEVKTEPSPDEPQHDIKPTDQTEPTLDSHDAGPADTPMEGSPEPQPEEQMPEKRIEPQPEEQMPEKRIEPQPDEPVAERTPEPTVELAPEITPEPDSSSCNCRNTDYICINGACEPKPCSNADDCLATCQYDPAQMQKVCIRCSTNTICATLTNGKRPICSGNVCVKQ